MPEPGATPEKWFTRRARLASGGYLVTASATRAIGMATAVWQVAGLRALATARQEDEHA